MNRVGFGRVVIASAMALAICACGGGEPGFELPARFERGAPSLEGLEVPAPFVPPSSLPERAGEVIAPIQSLCNSLGAGCNAQSADCGACIDEIDPEFQGLCVDSCDAASKLCGAAESCSGALANVIEELLAE